MKKHRIVLDTNILISALVFGGPPKTILNHAIEGDVQLLLSESILDELTHVLEDKKFRYPKEFIRHLTHEILSVGESVDSLKITSPLLRDPKDLHILECAVAGKADFIVTGDLDLLEMKVFSQIHILNPAAFLKILVTKNAD